MYTDCVHTFDYTCILYETTERPPSYLIIRSGNQPSKHCYEIINKTKQSETEKKQQQKTSFRCAILGEFFFIRVLEKPPVFPFTKNFVLSYLISLHSAYKYAMLFVYIAVNGNKIIDFLGILVLFHILTAYKFLRYEENLKCA